MKTLMKMSTGCIAIMAGVLLLLSCEGHHEPMEPGGVITLTADEITSLKGLQANNTVSPEDAREQAYAVINFMEGSQKLKSSASRYITNMEVVTCGEMPETGLKSTASDTDTLAYIFNFSDDSGFALISGDTRMFPLLAFSDNGSMGDTTNHPGLSLYFKSLENYRKLKIEEVQRLQDSLLDQTLAKLELMPGYEEMTLKSASVTEENLSCTSSWQSRYIESSRRGPGSSSRLVQYEIRECVSLVRTLEHCVPLIKTSWDQKSPSNDNAPYMNCRNQSNGRALAGCVPVGMGQIANYWAEKGYPIRLTHLTDRETNIPFTQANICEKYGNLLEAKYSCDGTSVIDLPLLNRIQNAFGGTDIRSSGLKRYDKGSILWNLRIGQPVLISGSTNLFFKDAHSWILDGFHIQQYYLKTTVTRHGGYSTSTRPGPVVVSETTSDVHGNDFVHCNWGWGGKGDGYYNHESFRAGQPWSVNGDGGNSFSGGELYNNWLYIVADIVPLRGLPGR